MSPPTPTAALPWTATPSPPSVPIASGAPSASPPPAPRAPPPTAQPYRAPGGLLHWVHRAAALGASDLHLCEGEPPFARVDGALRTLDDAPLSGLHGELLSAFGEAPLAPLGEGRSIDLGLDLGGGARGRLNVYTTAVGLAAALRILPDRAHALSELGFPVAIDELAMLPHGLVIVSGATGSGKSTTLAALAREVLRRRSVVLVSLEDPIEHVLAAPPGSLVRQRQVGRDVRDFHVGLRDALREDPDVILIGEMRDPESISLALTAAETGHLVLTSLHSRSAATAVERILDAYPGDRQAQIRLQLADALRAVIAQRLLPREGGGRVLAAEVLRATTAVSSAIREGKLSTIRSAMQAGKGDGMIPLEKSLAELVRRRAITVETARRAGCDLEVLAQYLG